MRKYHDLIESIKTLMEDSPPIAKGGQTIGSPLHLPTQFSNGKPKQFSLGGVKKIPTSTPEKQTSSVGHINHFASFISQGKPKPGMGLAIGQKPKEENIHYANVVHNAVTKFKDDDAAAQHIHKQLHGTDPNSSYDKLDDNDKNVYKQHVQHMRNVMSGQKFKQLVK